MARRHWTDRLWAKIDRRGDQECWPWLGAHFTDRKGQPRRGAFYFNGRNHQAHRVVYQVLVGIVPRWRTLVKAGGCVRQDCVNPAHWRPQ
jgi:hypothetical protein